MHMDGTSPAESHTISFALHTFYTFSNPSTMDFGKVKEAATSATASAQATATAASTGDMSAASKGATETVRPNLPQRHRLFPGSPSYPVQGLSCCETARDVQGELPVML